MGRKRKGPWWHKSKKCYVTTRPGMKVIVDLGTDEAKANKLYHQLMAEWVDDTAHQSSQTWTVAHLIDEYLDEIWHIEKITFGKKVQHGGRDDIDASID